MADDFDRASEREQQDRDLAIAAARKAAQIDLQPIICKGCDYATKASWGKTCDGWSDCLQDHQRAVKGRGMAA